MYTRPSRPKLKYLLNMKLDHLEFKFSPPLIVVGKTLKNIPRQTTK